MLCISQYCDLHLFLENMSPTETVHYQLVKLSGQKGSHDPHVCHSSDGLKLWTITPDFYTHAWDPNSGPDTLTASVLPTEPAPLAVDV